MVASRKKIICIILATTFFINSCSIFSVYANSYNFLYEGIGSEQQIAYMPRMGGGAIALSTLGITAILTLATYSGITFLDSESMDEFILRFVGLQNAKNLIVEASKSASKAKNGVVTFSRSFIDSVSSIFNKVTVNVDNSYEVIGNQRVLSIYSPTVFNSKEIAAIVNGSMAKDLIIADSRWETGKQDTRTIRRSNKCFVTYSAGTYQPTYGPKRVNVCIKCNGNASVDDKNYCTGSFLGIGETNYNIQNILPILVDNHPGYFIVEHLNSEVGKTGRIVYCKKHKLESSETIVKKKINAVIGTPWTDGTGTIPGTDGSTATDVAIPLPNDMGKLINTPSEKVANPTYPTWKPGESIAIPKIDNPGVSYVPDTGTGNPPDTGTENPPDTGTENPPDTGTENPPDTGTENPPDTGTDYPSIPSTINIPGFDGFKINFEPLTVSFDKFTNKFPFSIPWDFKRVVSAFTEKSKSKAYSGKAPVFEIPVLKNKMKLDLTPFVPLANLCKIFVGVGFTVILMLLTKKMTQH